ncbi:unnamed protein product [Dicrocoelium dendriticum]|nr:unnamed protein product [Dicrocoelium dendriticum]
MSTPLVSAVHPSSAPFKRFPSTALNRSHDTSHCACCLAASYQIPAKRACRPFSAASSLRHMHLCTLHSNYNDIHLLETHRSTLPRPIAVRLTPTEKCAVEQVSVSRSLRSSAFGLNARRCPSDANRSSRLSWHHPLFSNDTTSKPPPSNDIHSTSACSNAYHITSTVTTTTFAPVLNHHELLRRPLDSVAVSEVVHQAEANLHNFLTCGSESDASTSSGVESLLCRFSAFTPTRDSLRDGPQPSFSYSLSPGLHSVSSSVPLPALTPSSGFHETSFSCFPGVFSLPDCSKMGFRPGVHSCATERDSSCHPVSCALQHSTMTERSESPLLCTHLSHCDQFLRCWSQPMSIATNQQSPLGTVSKAAPTLPGSLQDPMGTMTAGLKRRRRKSIEPEGFVHRVPPSNCCCKLSECLAQNFEVEPTCDHSKNCNWSHSPVYPSPGDTSTGDVFVFGPCVSTLGGDLFHDDIIHGSQPHSDPRSGARTELWKPQISRDVCQSCKSFALDSDGISCRHLYPQLTDLSELAEEEKDSETPEFVPEDAGKMSNCGGQQSKHPFITSPSVFEVTFQPIRGSYDKDGQITRTTAPDLTHPPERVNQFPDSSNQPMDLCNPSGILIPLSSTDSDESADEVILSPRLIGRRRRNGEETANACDAPSTIPILDIDLELMENN